MTKRQARESLVAVIGDEDTVTGFLLAGVGNIDDQKNSNFLIVDSKTKHSEIENAFTTFAKSDNIGIILISQTISERIRYLVDAHDRLIPTVLEIPTKDVPWDPEKDSVVQKINKMMSADH